MEQTTVSVREASVAALRAKAPDVKATTLERYETGLKHFGQFVGELTPVPDAVTEDSIQEFKSFRVESGAAEQTLNNDLGAVSVLVSYAIKKEWLKERVKITRYKPKVRIRYLTPDQIRLYMAHLRSPFRPLFQLLLGTGMRLGEAEESRICDCLFSDDEARIQVGDSKTSSGVRVVFVPEWVAGTLKGHVAVNGLSGTDPLFSIPRGTIQQEHQRACRLAGIHEYTIHDHRHTAAVHLAKAGTPLPLIQDQLGHSRIEQTMQYARFHPDYGDLKKYFRRVADNFGLNPEFRGAIWGTQGKGQSR